MFIFVFVGFFFFTMYMGSFWELLRKEREVLALAGIWGKGILHLLFNLVHVA